MITSNRVIISIFRRHISNKGVPSLLDQIRHENGFKLFNLSQRYRIDSRKLQYEMQMLQKKLHPDKYVDSDLTTRKKSEHLSSIVNDLYNTLKDPYKRGKYLLSLITNKEQSEIETNLDNYKVDEDFLCRMMEIREKLDSLDSNSIMLDKLFVQLESELSGMIIELDKEFESNNIGNIYKLLAKLKFLSNCHQAIAAKLESFSKFSSF